MDGCRWAFSISGTHPFFYHIMGMLGMQKFAMLPRQYELLSLGAGTYVLFSRHQHKGYSAEVNLAHAVCVQLDYFIKK